MATTKLTRTMGTQGSSIKGTFSAWVKRASTGSDHDIYQHNYSSNYTNYAELLIINNNYEL